MLAGQGTISGWVPVGQIKFSGGPDLAHGPYFTSLGTKITFNIRITAVDKYFY